MKKFITIFVLAISIFTLSGFVGSNVLASTCSLGSQGFNANTGDLQFCVGGFPDKQSLRASSVQVVCDKETGAAFCGTTQPQSVSLSSVPDAQIAQASDGFYTCKTVTMSTKVEQVSMHVLDSSGASTCNFTGTVGLGNQNVNVTQPSTDSQITCGSDGLSVNTAIGCIPFGNQNELIGFFLKWGLGIGGGIAFILLLLGGFQIMTSRGDPNRLKAGQELLTSAIAGLLLLIFSLVILRIIGFDILKIQAFQ